MTHTLHRRESIPDLPGDFVILMMSARGTNISGSAVAMREFLRIASRFAPVNMGDACSGSRQTMSSAELENAVRDTSVVHAVFAHEESLIGVLDALKAADLGLSVTVTGPFEQIEKICRRVNLPKAPHTVAYSLGVWGRVELLPPEPLQDLCSLCGHALVSPDLTLSVARKVAEHHCTAEEGAHLLAKPCVCGVFNIERATAILRKMAADLKALQTGTHPAVDEQRK